MNVRRLHALFAPAAAVALMWMLLTGILLNASDTVRLDQHALPDSLLFLLDTSPPVQQWHWRVGRAKLSEIEGRLYWNARPLGKMQARQVAAFVHGWLILGNHRLLVLDDTGLEIAALPLPDNSAELAGTWPVQIHSPKRCWQLDSMLTQWTACTESTRTPILIDARTGGTPHALVRWKIDHQLTWKTLLQRMHSGHIFGQAGPWLLNGVSLLILIMLLSGLRLRHAKRPHASGS